MANIFQQLKGGDLRSIGKVNTVIKQIHTQQQFDELFEGLLSTDRLIAMRAADAIEKVTRTKKMFLSKHKTSLLRLLDTANYIEMKWHIALLVSKLTLTKTQFNRVWNKLVQWAIDKKESKIVRVNALQSLFELIQTSPTQRPAFNLVIIQLEKENIPSILARIKKLNC